MNAGERIFLIGQGGRGHISYAALLERVQSDRVRSPVCAAADVGEIAVELLKALYHECGLTLLDAQLTAAEREHLGVGEDELAAREALPSCECRDLAELLDRCSRTETFELRLFTSGSTGKPEQVLHRLPALTRTLRRTGAHAEDVWALCYNPAHLGGIQVLLQALFNLNTVVPLFGVPPAEAWRRLEQTRVTHLSATPTFYRMLLGESCTPNMRVRHVTIGGEPVDHALLEKLAERFPRARIRNHYAATEFGTLLISDGDVFEIAGAAEGRVRIERGTLWVHRSLVGKVGERQQAESGKLKAESRKPGGAVGGETRCCGKAESRKLKADEARQRGVEDAESRVSGCGISAFEAEWFDTGDVAEVVSSEPLRFRLNGRGREIVNVGGEKVNPAEVEAELRQHPAVQAARVRGRRSSVVGNILEAEIVAGEPMDEVELRRFLGERLHAAKIPRRFVFVEAIERTRTGKVVRS